VNQHVSGTWKWVDVTIELPAHHAGKTSGMCGGVGAKGWQKGPNFPGAPMPYVRNKAGEMATSWACNDVNLFTCHKEKKNCGYTKLACKSIAHRCKVPFIKDIPLPKYDDGYAVDPPGDGYAVEVAPPPQYENNENPAKVAVDKSNPPGCPPQIKTKAEDYCKKTIFCPNADKHVPAKKYMDDCVFDVCILKNYDYVETNKEAYFTKIRLEMQSRIRDPSTSMEAKLDFEKVQTGLGLGKADCKNGCKGQGVCRSYGCRCNPGFTGKDCSLDYRQEKF